MAPKHTNASADRYHNTPRKVFDKHVDRMEAKRQRDRADHRADMKALIHRLINLEQALQDLADHVAQHCIRMDPDMEHAEHPNRADTRDS